MTHRNESTLAGRRLPWLGLLAGLALLLPAPPAQADHEPRFCSRTARLQLYACFAELQDDRFVGKAICLNESDEEDAEECYEELAEQRDEGRDECRAQYHARRELCSDQRIGEGRYDPDFDPEDFETVFNDLNPYLPLSVGNSWKLANEEETIDIEVLDRTKEIEGVTCIVVRDVVEEDEALVEDTDDWAAQRSDGTVDYCGEEAKDYEVFEGDMPEIPELVETDGSFKHGRDGDKAGTLFPGNPVVGAKYRQEWSPSNAEDVAEVLAVGYGPGAPDERFDELVPEELLEIMCGDDMCVVTQDSSPLEPDVIEYKFHAYGVGVFFEVKPEDDESIGLVECQVSNPSGAAKCDALPEPEE